MTAPVPLTKNLFNSDPTAFCVIGYDWDEELYYVLDEYLDAEKTTEQHAVEIRDMIEKWDIDFIFIVRFYYFFPFFCFRFPGYNGICTLVIFTI